MTKHEMIELVVTEFRRVGLDPAIGCAIIQQESGWKADARSKPDAADEKHGGAFGLAQFLPGTAARLGFKGAPEGLFDPAVNIHLLAELSAQNAARFHTKDPLDIAAAHNSGKPFVRAPWSTVGMYVPHVMKHYAAWKRFFLEQPSRPSAET